MLIKEKRIASSWLRSMVFSLNYTLESPGNAFEALNGTDHTVDQLN
jgi:hypothetical protein